MFDNLTPADFIRETSAVHTLPNFTHSIAAAMNGSAYDLFVEQMLEMVRERANGEEDFIPFAVLSNVESHRYFTGEDDEVPADFANRLHREAQSMGAAWLFVAMVAPARAVYKDDEPPKHIDDESLEAVQEAINNGDLDLCVCWSSASMENGEHRTRAGIMYLDDEGDIGQEIEAPLNPDTDMFSGVLV